jgi:uncharacterized protein YbcI
LPEISDRLAEDEISREILALHKESYGTGARNLTVEIAEDVVLVLIDVELSLGEQTLLEAGKGEAVKAMRESFQVAVAANFNAIVERATGRRVASFYSGVNLDPVYSIELFRLEPSSR